MPGATDAPNPVDPISFVQIYPTVMGGRGEFTIDVRNHGGTGERIQCVGVDALMRRLQELFAPFQQRMPLYYEDMQMQAHETIAARHQREARAQITPLTNTPMPFEPDPVNAIMNEQRDWLMADIERAIGRPQAVDPGFPAQWNPVRPAEPPIVAPDEVQRQIVVNPVPPRHHPMGGIGTNGQVGG